MKLSEAIKIGATLRPESHQDRFCHVENRGLCSDAWGAACEAVQPGVAHFNWNARDRYKFERSMDALRAIQQHYFHSYWNMPAQCPGSEQRFVRAGGRIINRQGEIKIDGAEVGNLGGITSECDKVEHMAGMVDHLFYAHGWNREQVAEAVEWYEQTRSQASIARNFEHYAVN
jgi:hypothetical protein